MSKSFSRKSIIIIICAIAIVALSTVLTVVFSSINSNTTKEFKITFDKQGGTGGTTSITVKTDSSMPKATAPNKKGYVFAGYYSGANGAGTQYYSSKMESSRNWYIEQNATLYAYWISNENSNNSNSTSSQDKETQTGKAITLNKSNFNNYFTYTNSVSIEPFNSTNPFITTTTAIYYYSAKPKVKIKSESSLPIVSITAIISFNKSSNDYSEIYRTTINIYLYASDNFSSNSTWNMSFVPSEAKSYKINITSVSGTIFVVDN